MPLAWLTFEHMIKKTESELAVVKVAMMEEAQLVFEKGNTGDEVIQSLDSPLKCRRIQSEPWTPVRKVR